MENKRVKKLKGISKTKNKFLNASRGIYIAFKEESSLIVYLIAIILVIALGIWLVLSYDQWALLLLTIGVVIGFEFVNTSIENFVDLLSFEYNIKAKKIKDIGAAASIINALISVAIGFLILLPHLVEKIQGYF
ncbi:diacylglycerol kinase family protein [Spiroplasma endosymbiont of Labia minor]|uniref:diacylglycerol kinase family protein n=1 Tax=Spiroplasma endosymbiont of Labia minor TaxID=3066305 RepID=UPI0030CD1CE1